MIFFPVEEKNLVDNIGAPSPAAEQVSPQVLRWGRANSCTVEESHAL